MEELRTLLFNVIAFKSPNQMAMAILKSPEWTCKPVMTDKLLAICNVMKYHYRTDPRIVKAKKAVALYRFFKSVVDEQKK